MTFRPLTEPIDYVILAGERSPGIAELAGVQSPRRWDERRGYGFSGATVVFRGVGLARPVLKLRLIEPAHWEAWHSWRRLVQRPPLGERARAMAIWHPILEDLGITDVVVENVLQPLQTADGEWTVEIRFIEYRRPEFTLERIDGSDAETADPAEQAIERLTGILSNDGQGDITQALAPLGQL